MKNLHFTQLHISAEELVRQLRTDPQRSVAFMDWVDSELIEAFNAGEYTDLVTTYAVSVCGYRIDADVIVHHSLPIENRNDPFVWQANNRAPGASIIYRYPDRFEYDRLPADFVK